MRILFASLGCWAISAGPLSDLGAAVILSDVVAVMLADRELDRRPANRW